MPDTPLSPSRRRRPGPRRDVLAVNLGPVETRIRAKGMLRRYLLQGLSATEAQRQVRKHPDFAGKAPSMRAIQTWWSEIVHGDPVNLVDPELLAAAGHSLEDHRKAAIARSGSRVLRMRTVMDDLFAELAALEPGGKRNAARAKLESRILEADKRLGDAERNHARIIGYDEVPLTEQLTDDVGRSRIVHALADGWRYFTDAEVESLRAGLELDVARRAREAAEDAALEEPEDEDVEDSEA